MILYYTGTGNSRIIAEKIAAETGDEIMNAFEAIREKSHCAFTSDRPWVFVSPTYAWRIPKVFDSFIRRSRFAGSRDAYFVMTCGSDIGHAERFLKSLCEDMNLHFRGVREIPMPENYTAMFPVPDAEETERIIAAALPMAAETAERIKQGSDLPKRHISPADRLKSGFVNESFYMFWVNAKGFRVTDACTGCGSCERLCPTKTVKLKDGKPVWGKDCTHCMACINACPAKAIEYKQVSEGKPRIYNGKAR